VVQIVLRDGCRTRDPSEIDPVNLNDLERAKKLAKLTAYGRRVSGANILCRYQVRKRKRDERGSPITPQIESRLLGDRHLRDVRKALRVESCTC